MSTQDLKRGIVSPHCRHGGESPNIGRISRVRDVDPSLGKRSRSRSGRQRASRKKVPLAWTLLIGGTAMVTLVFTMVLWTAQHRAEPSEAENTATEMPAGEDRKKVESRFPSPSEQQTLEIVKLALSNRDPGKVPSLFRMGASSSAEITAFLQDLEKRDGKATQYSWIGSMDVEDLLLEGVAVTFKGKEKPKKRIAFLTPDAVGNWKLDFDAYARMVRPSWEKLVSPESRGGEVRVHIERGVYYNSLFSDDRKWVGYRLTSPDTDEILRGYCPVNTPLADSLAKLFKNEKKIARVTLEIRRVKGGEARQFEILRLLGEEWAVPDQASPSPVLTLGG